MFRQGRVLYLSVSRMAKIKINLKYLDKVFIGFCLLFIALGCGNSENEKTKITNGAAKQTPEVQRTREVSESKLKKDVDVIRLANRSASFFDETFGTPEKITPVKGNPKFMPGEYRQYRVKGHPKGLSVRFYKDKAKRFNLLLGKGEKSSKKALQEIFKIDVKNLRRARSDSLSETWKGKSGKVNFTTAYAKRNKAGGDFVMLHAEVK
jgi:hypothetical protein